MNIFIAEGNLGLPPKQISPTTYALRLAVSDGKGTLWLDALYFDESLGVGLTTGDRVLVNARLVQHSENSKSPKIIIETLEKK